MTPALILVKLIAAHLTADFILQPDRLCAGKKSGKPSMRYAALALHSIIHAALAYLFVARWSDWIVPAVIGAGHFAIDRITATPKDKRLPALVADQAAHLAVILLLWWFDFVMIPDNVADSHQGFASSAWLIFTAYIAILSPASILIKSFVEYEKWMPAEAISEGLPNAGKWIGYLERILILTFILTDNIEGVGFLLAAKSVFRFGELNKAEDIRITEYVLIGTFASFTTAIMTGFAVKWLLDLVWET